jgi:phosphoribosylpyrophosphate synthetase
MVALLESFIESMTVVLPFYPMGTMERVIKEGCVATANTVARILSNLPLCGRPTRVMFYDLHTLQNRFYLSGGALASLHTTIPLLLREIGAPGSAIDSIAFPDDGANKRFGYLFKSFPLITCGKQREGNERIVKIQDGDANGKRVLIVDDMSRSGGTLVECAKALKKAGAAGVSAYVAHFALPIGSGLWKKFARGGEKAVFDTFYSTNSCPVHVAELPSDDVFKILDLTPLIMEDL